MADPVEIPDSKAVALAVVDANLVYRFVYLTLKKSTDGGGTWSDVWVSPGMVGEDRFW